MGSIKGGFRSERAAGASESLGGAAQPVDGGSPRKDIDVHWVRPELQAEIEMAEFTASGMLRQRRSRGCGMTSHEPVRVSTWRPTCTDVPGADGP